MNKAFFNEPRMMTIRIEDKTHKELRILSAIEDLSLNSLINRIILEYIQNHKDLED